MAKLIQVHLAGVGHQEAKFHPLTMRFDRDMDPINTVVNLRNGGGKTTLLSLIYAVLLPHKTDFLGRVNGSNRTIDEYFPLGKLGVVAVEMKSEVGRFGLILAWVRREREEPPILFSFRTEVDGIPFASLPIQGLSSPVSSLAELRRWLEDQHNKSPAQVDLYVAPNFREWHTHLKRSRRVDSHLYRSHLQMNRSEGAVDEEFKFTKNEQFVKRFLSFAIEAPIDEREMEDPVTESLKEHRLSLLNEPHYKKELEFISEIVPHLTEVAGHCERRTLAEKQRSAAYSELSQLADGVLFFIEKFTKDEEILKSVLSIENDSMKSLLTQRENARRYAEGYSRRAKELHVAEARKAYDEKKAAVAKIESRQKEVFAALAWRTVLQSQSTLNALQEQRANLLKELRPVLASVQTLAARLNAAFDAALDAAEVLHIETKEALADSLEEIKKLNADIKHLTVEQSNSNASWLAVQADIARAYKARERLVTSGCIETREEIDAAYDRLEQLGDRLRMSSEAQRKAAESSRVQGITYRTNSAKLANEAKAARVDADKAKADIARFEQQRDNCAALKPVRDALEGGGFDPFNPGLVSSLRKQEQIIRRQIADMDIEQAEDSRLLSRFEAGGKTLFPAAIEIESLVEKLRLQKVPAFTAYQWLNLNGTTEQARERIRRDPATFSGIIVNTAGDLEAARQICSTAHLSRPVKITLSASLVGKDENGGVVILPERSGLFNAHAAEVEISGIKAAQDAANLHRGELLANAEVSANAARAVSQLQLEYSKEWLDSTLALHRQRDALSCRLLSDSEQEMGLALRSEEDFKKKSSEADDLASRAQKAENQLSQVNEFRVTYGQLPRWLEDEKKLGQKIDEQKKAISEAELALLTAEEDLKVRQNHEKLKQQAINELQLQRTTARVSSYIIRGATVSACDSLAVELARFEVARDEYEKQSTDAVLNERISQAERADKVASGAFQQFGFAEKQIEGLSNAPDLDHQKLILEEGVVQSRTEFEVAKQALSEANKNAPGLLSVNQRADLDPAISEPQTAVEAEAHAKAKFELADATNSKIEDQRERVAKCKEDVGMAASASKEYKGLLEITQPGKPTGPRESMILTGSPEGDRVRVKENKARFDLANKTVNDLAVKIDDAIDRRIDPLLKSERWDAFSVDVLVRMRKLNRGDLLGISSQLVRESEERRVGLVSKMEEITAIRSTLIEKLSIRANEAISLLMQAQRLSRMPDGIGAWSGREFLRVHIPTRGNAEERQKALGNLLSSWMSPAKKDMAIPSGATLAYECLSAVLNGKDVEAEILKPETSDPSVCNYQPITKLAAFSGGQRVTAAILLYCVVVRVRSDKGELLRDCGFLMLDNPFGKASHFPLVDLQLKMAEVMGVQLLYMTGINDFEALAAFPMRVRLRNSARNSLNGERLVQHEQNAVTAIRHGILNNGHKATS